jgi:hypothetical protein
MEFSPRGVVLLATLSAALVVLPGHAPAAEAEAEEAPGGLAPFGELDVVSRYVWRAITFSDGAVLQPTVGLSAGPLELGVWANVDPSLPGSSRVNEVDYSAAWTFGLGLVEAKPSILFYSYPGDAGAGTGELQLELRRAVSGGLCAYVRHSTDVFDYPGASLTATGLDREWSFESGGSFSLSTQVGWGSQQFSDAYLPGSPPLTLVGAAASWTVPVGRGWAVRPHLDWLEVVDDEARAMLPVHTPLTIGVAFGRL